MRKLTRRQKKILNQQADKGITNWDELSIEIIEQLEAINNTEILWQEVNRYFNDAYWTKKSVLNKYMVSAIVIIAKQQPQHTYIVKVEDWLNPSIYVIDAQDPYTGDTAVVLKAQYKLGWVIDENGEANYSF